jgi:dTDP-4-amino-4,6-dideoxygalactose transaminase
MLIPFEKEYRKKYYDLLEQVFDSGFLSEGTMQKRFEQSFADFTNVSAVALNSGGAALLALYEYANVRGKDVIVPANTFWATAQAAKLAGANVIYADCNKNDLCISFEDLKRKVTKNTRAVCVTHIGGHIAFEINEIAEFCNTNNITLIEDCAHAHGATWDGRAAGSWGLGGAYSFYATKTLPLGDGGIVVSHNENFLNWLKHFRNYGKEVVDTKVSYPIKNGFNYRMNEVTAAFGLVQMERLPMILKWKRNLAAKFDQIFENRVQFPDGMISGYYKYIVFDAELNEETGKVFNYTDFGNEIEGNEMKHNLPNSYWIAEHHKCPPIWYGWEKADASIEQLEKILMEPNIS